MYLIKILLNTYTIINNLMVIKRNANIYFPIYIYILYYILWIACHLLSVQANADGRSCSTCRAGSFHLSSENHDGCVTCFCMGVTSQCTNTEQRRDQVSVLMGWGGVSCTNCIQMKYT